MKEKTSESIAPSSSGKRLRLETLNALSQALLREVSELKSDESKQAGEIDLVKELESYETYLIRSALMRTGGRQSQAAQLLNIKASTLCAKIKRYRILEKTQIVL